LLLSSKTAAAITGESGVLKHNLIADLQGKKVEQAVYDGYSSCPMILSRDRLILAEYSGYTSMPLETFPFDQRKLSKVSQYLNKEVYFKKKKRKKKKHICETHTNIFIDYSVYLLE
jgi:sulfide:quinone oxidoreductase